MISLQERADYGLYLVHKDQCMPTVSPVFHTVETVTIGLKTQLRMGTSIP